MCPFLSTFSWFWLFMFTHIFTLRFFLATFSLNFVQVGKGEDLKTIFIFQARCLKNGERDFSGQNISCELRLYFFNWKNSHQLLKKRLFTSLLCVSFWKAGRLENCGRDCKEIWLGNLGMLVIFKCDEISCNFLHVFFNKGDTRNNLSISLICEDKFKI